MKHLVFSALAVLALTFQTFADEPSTTTPNLPARQESIEKGKKAMELFRKHPGDFSNFQTVLDVLDQPNIKLEDLGTDDKEVKRLFIQAAITTPSKDLSAQARKFRNKALKLREKFRTDKTK